MTRHLAAPRQRWAVSRIRRPGWALVGLAGGLLFLAACATAPEERYFRVDPALPAPTAEAPLPVTLGVARVAAPEPYRQERILYRTSPYEVQLYGADRWESSPVDMVGHALLERLRRSGLFRRVVPWRRGEADVRLEVRLRRFEEVDEADGWYGVVELEYEVVDGDGKSLLRGGSDQRVRAEAHTVNGVVRALSRGLAVSLDEVTVQTAAAIKAAHR
jgi:ABC-type uncharacterized transport system auxiliary subunit